jgi:hypothetical protein
MVARIFLTVFFVIFTISVSFAQFSFGGKLGGASTNLTGVGLKNFVPEPKVKLVGGGIVNYSFGQRLAVQTEVLYSGKGSNFKYTIENYNLYGDATVNFSQKLGYLGVPLMLQFKMGDRSNYFHFDGGIVYNSLIHHKYLGTIDFVNSTGTNSNAAFLITQTPAKQDLSYAFGIGLIANGLNFDFRYEVGTKAVFESSIDAPEILNKSFQVSVGYTVRY